MRFLYSATLRTRFGHLAIEPYYVVKAQRACVLMERFVLRDTTSVNPCLFDYWRSFFNFERDRPGLDQIERAPESTFHSCPSDVRAGDLRGIPAQEAIEQVVTGGVLALTNTHLAEGHATLKKALGREPEPMVCLHVRDDGYFGTNMPYHRYRNADIDTYALACQEIVKRGYLVVVMGSPKSKPFSMPGVFDYAHSPIRSDRMDIYLLGNCRFFLGTPGGCLDVATVFGRPCVATNKAPMNCPPYTSRDLFIPKRVYGVADQRLSIDDVLDSEIRNYCEAERYAKAYITLVDNTPEEIRDAALEMLASQPETREQQAFRARLQQDPANRSLSRIGQVFLQAWTSTPLHTGSRELSAVEVS